MTLDSVPESANALPSDLRDALFAGKDVLPESVERQIVTLGEAAVPWLIEVAVDPELADMDAPGEGLAPLHAVKLLGVIGSPSAAPTLIDLLAELDDDEVLYNEICLALPRFGAALLEPALAVLATNPSEATLEALCSGLAESGVKDERIFERLTRLFEENTELGAYAFSQYGDAHALPLLAERVRGLEVGARPAMTRSTLAELTEAYGRIAGSLPDDLKEHTASLRTEIEAALATAALARASNDGAVPVFLRQLEGAPGKPWVCASTCEDPDCDCREATLFFTEERTALDPILGLIAAGAQDKELWEHARLHPTRGLTLAEIEIDDGSVASLIDDTGAIVEVNAADAPAAAGGSDEVDAGTQVASLLDGKLLDDLNAHWCRGKGIDPNVPASLERFPWKQGEKLAWTRVFCRARPDIYTEGARLFELVENYCPLRDCACNEVVLQWMEFGRKERVLSTVAHRLGSALPQQNGGDPVLARLWTRFSERYPNTEQHFAERQQRIHEFGARLLAHRAARRPERVASKWVSSSRKGRRDRKGKKMT